MATWILPTHGGIPVPDLVKFHEPTSPPKSKGKLYVKKVAAVSLFQEILIVFYLLSESCQSVQQEEKANVKKCIP